LALAKELAAAFGADDFERTVHKRIQPRPARTAVGRWRNVRRVAVGVAAAMVAGVALWTQQQDPPSAAASAAPDRIFAAFDDRSLAGQGQPDEIFNGSFRGDVIFRSSGG
jgi:hypothetical protein